MRIETARGKFHETRDRVGTPFYRQLADAIEAATKLNEKSTKPADDYWPVVSVGPSNPRMFVKAVKHGSAWVVEQPHHDETHGFWAAFALLALPCAREKREVTPERREQLSAQLEKARAARRSA